MRSMTGFGRGQAEVAGRRIGVEIRSVNHRFLEVKQRLPWSDLVIEHELGQVVRRRIDRGSITVAVRDEGGAATGPELRADLDLARAYAREAESIRAACHLNAPVAPEWIADRPGVLQAGGQARDSEALWAQLSSGVEQALDDLVASREREGGMLGGELRAGIAKMRQLLAELVPVAAQEPEQMQRRLAERLVRLAAQVEIDPQRLAQEAALLAERADIGEELARFRTHVDETERLLTSSSAIGRRLDFLAQELHREINTIGAKSQSAQIVRLVIDLKVEVERIREQVQNIE